MSNTSSWRSHLRLDVIMALVALVALVLAADASASASPASPASPSCSNEAFEGFREYLPDCGAYEFVSPRFKGGNAIQQVAAMAVDGSRMIVGAVGAFAGTESDVFGAKYAFTRTPMGWRTESINPPAEVFSATDSKVFAASTNISSTLWGLRGSSQSTNARDLYLRSPEGTFTEIGPTEPPSASEAPAAGGSQEFVELFTFSGANDDLSTVLFRATGVKVSAQPWPGDTTVRGGNSLYDYEGVGNARPRLLGVSDGSTRVHGEVLAAGRLISDCATYLGAIQNEDVYNAVSRTGEKVFFSATGLASAPSCEAQGGHGPEFDELYARISNLETVAISEPTPAQCDECQTTVQADAIFQGASEDGSKVFFLTEQELLPGSEGMSLYEYDFANRTGRKVVRIAASSMKPEVLGVARVSEDGSHVYFVAKGALTGPNREGFGPSAGSPNLYVFERDATFPAGRVAFVGTLSEADERDWAERNKRPFQVTPSGRYAAFESAADLTSGDTSTLPQVFEYDAQTEELARASVGQVGYGQGQVSADENSSTLSSQEFSRAGGFKPTAAQTELAISADGREILFHSAGALTPLAAEAAEAGAESIYEYRSSDDIRIGETFLISDGKNKLTPQGDPASLTTDGANAFFLSIDPILPEDGDQQFDLYDAHSGGGFPLVPVSPPCAGEACQGNPMPLPVFGAGPTLAVSGAAAPSSPAPPLVPNAMSRSVAKPRLPTRAQRLSKALKSCKRKKGKQRASCEFQARKRFGVKEAAKKGVKKEGHQ